MENKFNKNSRIALGISGGLTLVNIIFIVMCLMNFFKLGMIYVLAISFTIMMISILFAAQYGRNKWKKIAEEVGNETARDMKNKELRIIVLLQVLFVIIIYVTKLF